MGIISIQPTPIKSGKMNPPPGYADEAATPHVPPLNVRQQDKFGTQAGTLKAIAAKQVSNKAMMVILIYFLGLAAFMMNLDQYTNYTLLTQAFTDANNVQAQYQVGAATAILLAVGKPFFGKMSNVIGRPEALTVTLFFIVLGYVVTAASDKLVSGLAAGQVFWQLGFSGFQILLNIIVADNTNLRYRGFWTGMINVWTFVLFALSSPIISAVKSGLGWRWAFGLEAICYLPASLPAILVLFLNQYRAKKAGLINYQDQPLTSGPWKSRIYQFIVQHDVIGLYLLIATLCYIFLPIILAGTSALLAWDNAYVPASMVVGGFIILPALIYWELKCASFPIIPHYFIKNINIVITCLINFFDFICFYLSYQTLSNYMAVAVDWYTDLENGEPRLSGDSNYYSYCQNISLTFFGIAWGIIASVFKPNWKWSVVVALCIRLLGVGLMLYARDNRNLGALVMTQVLQGAGGGIAAIATQVGAQGSVPQQQMALATAAILLFAEIGNVVGQSASSAINSAFLPQMIAEQFPSWSATQVNKYVSAPMSAVKLGPVGTEQRDKMIQAFSNNQRKLIIPAIVFGCVPIILSLFLKNFKLDERQNAVEDLDENGHEVLAYDSERTNTHANGDLNENARDSHSEADEDHKDDHKSSPKETNPNGGHELSH
ncbi:Siderophore iron transporter 3 [Wallemia ichthyophaga EXF-994]|uniref:Siderophore iron transporter 3 n=2 Tax=Wallemia ichthyophaga TaxID=245174 RepID=R9A9Y4_WALI9|nr:Siderophore iron transporter 3 [Wallemia ichthyophaga EXF-994]EOQ99033.1 Siderophore iron transporter 3 [Wallemia ichthyophaga EXF-994]